MPKMQEILQNLNSKGEIDKISLWKKFTNATKNGVKICSKFSAVSAFFSLI